MKTTLRLIIIIILVSASLILSKNIYTQASKFKEIYPAEAQVAELSKEQEALKSTLEKQTSAVFLEKQARDKLGFQKPGEIIYVVLDPEKSVQDNEKTNKKNWEGGVGFILR